MNLKYWVHALSNWVIFLHVLGNQNTAKLNSTASLVFNANLTWEIKSFFFLTRLLCFFPTLLLWRSYIGWCFSMFVCRASWAPGRAGALWHTTWKDLQKGWKCSLEFIFPQHTDSVRCQSENRPHTSHCIYRLALGHCWSIGHISGQSNQIVVRRGFCVCVVWTLDCCQKHKPFKDVTLYQMMTVIFF